MDKHVRDRGHMRPVHRFRHGLQAAYSRAKGGVDCAAQMRSELNCSGTSPGWEQNVMHFFHEKDTSK